jgi:response regulator of citrate/malate metabolism
LSAFYILLRGEFDSREDVIDWMYSNQLDKRNLTDEKRKYLVGKQTEHRLKPRGGTGANQFNTQMSQNETSAQTNTKRTTQKIAEEQGVSRATVDRSLEYSRAIDDISQNVVGKPDKEKIDNEEKKTIDNLFAPSSHCGPRARQRY